MKIAKSGTLVSILMIFLVLSIASLGTFAYFNDVETLGQNVFSAGTLELEVSHGSSIPITLGNMAPGDGTGGTEHTTITYQFIVKNVGTLDGILSMKIVNVKNYENGQNEPEQAVDTTGGDPGLGAGELGQYLNLQINQPGPAGFYYGLQGCANAGCLGGRKHSINCWEDHTITVGTLPAGTQWAACVLEFELPPSVGNIIQSDSVEFSVEIRLDQAI